MVSVDQLILFVSNHWLLFIALVIILGLLIYNLIIGEKGSIEPLSAVELINRREAVIIDVRSAADFTQGHIIHAINIPDNDLSNQLNLLIKYKERPVIINCRSGARSAQACNQLRKAGFSEVYNLRGGLLAWETAGLPLSRNKRS